MNKETLIRTSTGANSLFMSRSSPFDLLASSDKKINVETLTPCLVKITDSLTGIHTESIVLRGSEEAYVLVADVSMVRLSDSSFKEIFNNQQ